MRTDLHVSIDLHLVVIPAKAGIQTGLRVWRELRLDPRFRGDDVGGRGMTGWVGMTGAGGVTSQAPSPTCPPCISSTRRRSSSAPARAARARSASGARNIS